MFYICTGYFKKWYVFVHRGMIDFAYTLAGEILDGSRDTPNIIKVEVHER